MTVVELFIAKYGIAKSIYWNPKCEKFVPRSYSATVSAQKANDQFNEFKLALAPFWAQEIEMKNERMNAKSLFSIWSYFGSDITPEQELYIDSELLDLSDIEQGKFLDMVAATRSK